MKINSIKTILFASVIMSFFTGCDETTIYNNTINETNKTIDNTVLADGENQYGYFGLYLIFGEDEIVGKATVYNDRNGDKQTLNFFSDGEGEYIDVNQTNSTTFDYGVSQDGKLIQASYGAKMEIVGANSIYEGQDANGNPIYSTCYLVSYEQRFGSDIVRMCLKTYEGQDANGNPIYS